MQAKLATIGYTPTAAASAAAAPTAVPVNIVAEHKLMNELVNKKKQGNQLHNYVCTIFPDNFPSPDALDATISAIGGECSYAVFGLESAPSTGRAHIHGVAVFDERIRLTQLKKQFPACIHWEPMKGTLDQAVDYVMKEDKNPVVFGEKPTNPGEMEKNRWRLAREQLEQGDVDALEDDQIYVQHFSSVSQIADRFAARTQAQDLEQMPEVYFCYGVPGAGKSQWCRHHANAVENSPLYLKDFSQWWCAYDSRLHTGGVLIEDIGLGDKWMVDRLKLWTDRYAFAANRKNRPAMMIRPKRIYITSNYSLEQLFGDSPIDVVALQRRCTVMYFPKVYPGSGLPIFEVQQPIVFDEAKMRTILRNTAPGTVSTFSHLPSSSDDIEESDDDTVVEVPKPKPRLTRQSTIAPRGSAARPIVIEESENQEEDDTAEATQLSATQETESLHGSDDEQERIAEMMVTPVNQVRRRLKMPPIHPPAPKRKKKKIVVDLT